MKTIRLLKICSFFVALSFPIQGYCQTSSCFTLDKVKKIYASTFLEINSMLYQENWEITVNANQTHFVFGNDSVLCDNFSQWKYDLSAEKRVLSLYRTKGIDPILLLQTSKNCYETLESSLSKNNQKIEEDAVRRLKIIRVKKGMDFIFSSPNNPQSYLIIVCNYTQLDSLIKAQIAEKNNYEMVLYEQRKFIQTTIEQADSLKNVNHYAAAILVLKQALNQPFLERDELIGEIPGIKNLIDTMEKEWEIKKFNAYCQLADSAFAKENYALAKENWLQAKQINRNAPEISQRLEEIAKIESMLITRKDSVFNYKFYNKSTCENIQSSIFRKIKGFFLNLDAGNFNFNFTLSTDTLKQNLSSHEINSFLLSSGTKPFSFIDYREPWSLFLDSLIQSPSILPVKINNLYVNTSTVFQYHSSWKTELTKVISGVKKIRIVPKNIPAEDTRIIKEYFKNDWTLPNGEYTIERKNILFQDSSFSTLTLKKYYVVGPEAIAYSMLLPGAGSLAATQGRKGWAALSTFIGFTGLAIAEIVWANTLKPGPIKNAIKYVSYGTFGISGVIYICDMFIALKHGMDNLKKSRALKEKLNENYIYLQEFPQQIEY